ncbi:glutamyl-tRNA reductase [Halobacteriales archaeon QS_8_69_26]|nr:MAG: glutamyl-tRNA reductase [Halobacteriales archaeon QS_8_69_26]
MTTSGIISGVRVTHGNATVDEIAAAGTDDVRTDVAALRGEDGVREAYVLRTCNRAEAYVVTDDTAVGRSALEWFVADVPDDAVVASDHEGSLRHLMRVAAGMDSMVLGEDRILGQVREAYEDARGAGGIGPVLEGAVTKAIHVGERVRNETAVNEGVVSLGSAAAEHLRESVDLTESTAAVVGAGAVARTVAGALADRGVGRLVVVNRTVPNAEAVAETVDADAEGVGLDALAETLSRADVAVAATAATDPVIERGTVADADELVVVDMAQPRDVAPAVDAVEGVTRYDLDALESVTAETRERRREAAERAGAIIEEEFEHLLDQFKRKRADEVIAAMHESAERVKERELGRAVGKLQREGEFTEEQREVVESMADALVSQLLAAPTKSLREAAAEDDWTTIATALQLFDPEFGADAPDLAGTDLPADAPPEAIDALGGDTDADEDA